MGIRDRWRKKKPASKEGANSSTRHCFVLCRSARPASLSRAASVVTRIFGPNHAATIEEDSNVIVMCGDEAVGVLVHVPAPVPEGEAEECADGNFFWPGGREEVAQHRSHVVVASLHNGDATPVQTALAVSRLALVALELFDGIGVYWGNACVCHSRHVFELFCNEMSPDHLPLPVWLRFDLFRASDDAIGVCTTGMAQFGLMEIEVDRCTMSPRDLCEFVADLAHYLVLNGPVIQDGNTVGQSADQRIRVRHLPSMMRNGQMVYKLIFDA